MKIIKKGKEGDRKMEVWRKIDNLKKAGLSYNQIAKKVGVSKTTVRRWHLEENYATCKNELKIDKLMWDELQNPDKLTRNGIIRPKHDFKVGDRVQFKSWKEMEDEFGLDCWGSIDCGKYTFLKRMAPLCGTFATIERLSPDSTVCELTDFSYKGDTNYVYETYMIKPFSVNEQIKWHEQQLAELKAQKEKEKWQFSEDEKVILRNLDKKFKWIARDQDGQINIYDAKIKKTQGEGGKGIWVFQHSGMYYVFDIFNHLFQCIQWSDGEPCEFRKFV